MVELKNLIAASNKVCEEGSRKGPALVILKMKSRLKNLPKAAGC